MKDIRRQSWQATILSATWGIGTLLSLSQVPVCSPGCVKILQSDDEDFSLHMTPDDPENLNTEASAVIRSSIWGRGRGTAPLFMWCRRHCRHLTSN